jgi:hypothetical protein
VIQSAAANQNVLNFEGVNRQNIAQKGICPFFDVLLFSILVCRPWIGCPSSSKGGGRESAWFSNPPTKEYRYRAVGGAMCLHVNLQSSFLVATAKKSPLAKTAKFVLVAA